MIDVRSGIWCVFVAVLGFVPLAADEPRASSVLRAPGIDELAQDMVSAIDALGQSDCDSAAALLVRYMPAAAGTTGGDHAARARAMLHPFQERPFGFESVDFVAAERVSSAALSLAFIGNSVGGPVLFQVYAFRYGEAWRLGGFHFQFGWDTVAERSRVGRFAEPVTYRLAANAVRCG
jgi:hypothetical protein